MAQANARVVAITVALQAVATFTTVSTASAQGGGGASYRMPPSISSAACVADAGQACSSSRTVVRGGSLRLRGSRLDQAAKVVFEGSRGRSDDASAVPDQIAPRRLELTVPAEARSGKLVVVDQMGRSSNALRVRVVEAPPLDLAPGSKFFFDGRRRPSFSFASDSTGPARVEIVRESDQTVVGTLEVDAQPGDNTVSWNGLVRGRPAAPGAYAFRLAGATTSAAASSAGTAVFNLFDHVFPIRGRHNLGYTRTNQFGGGRGHQGIDMFAKCGIPLAAARGGKVQYAGYHARAGNYVVIDGRGTGVDYVYMHMNAPPLVRTGQRVFTGQKIGEVGDTGNADGCHLHFETWSAPGWYQGGKPFDPRALLATWDRYS